MTTILKAERWVDVEKKELQTGPVFVVLEGNRIKDITKNKPNKVSKLIDLGKSTLAPGLIDAHVHLQSDPYAPVHERVAPTVGAITINALRHGEMALKKGVTTMRDCGGFGGAVIDVAKAERAGLLPRIPRIFAAGHNICMTGGHGHSFGVEADGSDEVRKATRRELKAGADLIKVMATGGVMTPGVEMGSVQFSVEELQAAVEEAHKAGKKVASHAQASQGILNALKAGVDTIEHASYIDDEGLMLMKEQGNFLVGTLIAAVRQYEYRDKLPEFVQRKIVKHVERERDSLRRAIAAGINIACGTDAGTPYNEHGNLVDQMEIFVELGMSPLEALASGTTGSAKALGIDDVLGRLEPGYYADIVAVEGFPEKDITDLRKVLAVFKNGEIAFKN